MMRWFSRPWQLAAMLLPALALYSLYFVYPIVYSVVQSFTDAQAFGSNTFVGADNYEQMAADPLFWSSLGNTGIILAVAVLVLLPGAFGLALLLRGRMRGAGIMRAAVFAPNVIAPILIGLIWVFILDPQLGLLNALLRGIGVDNPPVWLGGTTMSPYSIGIVSSGRRSDSS